MVKKAATKKKPAKKKAAKKTRRASGTRRNSPAATYVVVIVMNTGAKGALPRSLRRLQRGDKVTFVNSTSVARSLDFPSSPFKGSGEQESVILEAQGSPGAIRTKTIHEEASDGAFGFDVRPPANPAAGPPGEPEVVVGG